MAVAWYWARTELRRRWRAWLTIGVLVGVGGGVVMGALIGARRTHAAYPRLQAWADPPDLVVDPDFDSGNSQTFLDALLRVPGVAQRSDARAVALGRVAGDAIDLASVMDPVASVDGERFFDRDRVLVTEGRMPDPRRADEVLVSESAAIDGIAVGDRLDLRALPVSEVFGALETGVAIPAGMGEPFVVEVTGIGTFAEAAAEEPADVADRMLVTPALYEQVPEHAHLWDRTGIYLTAGAEAASVRRDIQDLAAALGGSALFEVRDDIAARTQRSVRPYVLALAGVGAAGAAFLALLTLQLLRRLGAEADRDHDVLRMLSSDRGTSRLARVLPAALTGSGAAVVAVAVAVAVGGSTPVGPVRRLTAVAGPALDWTVLGPGLASLAAVVVAPGLLAARSPRSASLQRRSGFAVTWARQTGLPLPALLGIGGATGDGGGHRRSVARSGIASVALAAGMLVAVATFSASLAHLLDNPELHGWNADLALLGQDGYGSFDLDGAADVDGIDSLTGAVFGSVTVGDVDVAGMGVVALRGAWSPPIVEGRAPTGPGEVLVGHRTFEGLGVEVGDEIDVRLPGDAGPRSMRIAGTAIFPGIGQLDNDRPTLGEGVLVALPDDVVEEIETGWSALFAQLSPGADREAVVEALVAAAAEATGDADVIEVARPADIATFARLGFVPTVLLGLFALVALASLVHVSLVAARSWRRDRAVLAALGASPRQLRSATRWHAATVVGLSLLVAVPAGMALGRWSWRTLAVEIGIVPDPVLPVAVLAGLVTGLFLTAVVAATLPERAHAAVGPGPALRTE